MNWSLPPHPYHSTLDHMETETIHRHSQGETKQTSPDLTTRIRENHTIQNDNDSSKRIHIRCELNTKRV